MSYEARRLDRGLSRSGNRERVVEIVKTEVQSKTPVWVWIVGAILIVLIIVLVILWLLKKTPDQINAVCTVDTDCATTLVCTNQKCQVPVNLKSGLGGNCTKNDDCYTGLSCGDDDICHVDCDPPQAVTNVVFENDVDDLVISWTASSGADSYLVVISEVSNPTTGISIIYVDEPTYTFPSPTPGTYSFVIWPVSQDCGIGNSALETNITVPV